MAIILYIDTSADSCTVALSKDGKVLRQSTGPGMQQQAALINVRIQQVMAESNTDLEQVEAIAVCAGPGSYTGLRVALSAAKGLCFALDKPLMLFGKLYLVALSSGAQGTKLVVLKARQSEYFIAGYDNNMKEVIAPSHILQAGLSEYLTNAAIAAIITDDMDSDLFRHKNAEPLSHAINVERWKDVAEKRWEQQQFDDVAYSEPFYLKKAFTTQPKNKF